MTITEFINTGCGVDAVSVIYKLTNLQNGKIYIGQTKGSLRKRIISHLSHANKFTKSKKHHYNSLYRNMVITIFKLK